jgi:hypothetical protein
MHRRIALAISLALTVITAFSVVTVGAKAGIFSGGSTAGAEPQVLEQLLPTAAPTEPQPVVAPALPPDPIVITEYVYIDEPAPANPAQAQRREAAVASTGKVAAAAVDQQATAPGAADTAMTPTEAPAPTSTGVPSATRPAARDDDEDEREDEDDDEEDGD